MSAGFQYFEQSGTVHVQYHCSHRSLRQIYTTKWRETISKKAGIKQQYDLPSKTVIDIKTRTEDDFPTVKKDWVRHQSTPTSMLDGEKTNQKAAVRWGARTSQISVATKIITRMRKVGTIGGVIVNTLSDNGRRWEWSTKVPCRRKQKRYIIPGRDLANDRN